MLLVKRFLFFLLLFLCSLSFWRKWKTLSLEDDDMILIVWVLRKMTNVQWKKNNKNNNNDQPTTQSHSFLVSFLLLLTVCHFIISFPFSALTTLRNLAMFVYEHARTQNDIFFSKTEFDQWRKHTHTNTYEKRFVLLVTWTDEYSQMTRYEFISIRKKKKPRRWWWRWRRRKREKKNSSLLPEASRFIIIIIIVIGSEYNKKKRRRRKRKNIEAIDDIKRDLFNRKFLCQTWLSFGFANDKSSIDFLTSDT